MFKVIITFIFIFLAFGIVGISFLYKNKDASFADLNNNKKIIEPKSLSIKEIQRLTAQSNYHFTVFNAIH